MLGRGRVAQTLPTRRDVCPSLQLLVGKPELTAQGKRPVVVLCSLTFAVKWMKCPVLAPSWTDTATFHLPFTITH